jgi:glycogen debranching enzyme
VISASATSMEDAILQYQKTIIKPIIVNLSSLRYNNGIFNRKLSIRTPDLRFNEGYKWAIVGTDHFFVNTTGIGRSLVAGYATTDYGWDGGHKVNGRPGYAWYFGRDGAWSSYAVLAYGDFEKVRDVLDQYGRFQDVSGKIYHELTTSGVAHYDAADATPLYISLAGQYLRHSGDTAFIRSQWTHIRKALEFCYSTDTDQDGLIENTLVGHGWEEGGILFGTHTTFYLASCWAEALHQASYMARYLGILDESRKYATDEGHVLRMLNTDFWNPNQNFFYHGKYKDNTYHPEPDVMAAVSLLYGQVPERSKSDPVLQTLASNEFSTDWGVRIIGDNSQYFKPGSYHQGSVWPLFTGWTSLAEYRCGRPTEGFTHLMDNLLTYHSWAKGFVPEVIHGEIYKPFGVCAHQCWSETMVLEPAIEGMLGLQPDALQNRLTLSPAFPANWDSVEINNIRMGQQLFDISYTSSAEKLNWKIRRSVGIKDNTEIRLNLRLPAGTRVHRVMVNGKEFESEFREDVLGLNLLFSNADMGNTLNVEIYRTGGISALPEVAEPLPGSKSEGYRIISEALSGDQYIILLRGKSGADAAFSLNTANGFSATDKRCTLQSQSGNIYNYSIHFPEADSKYVSVPLSFTIK